MKPLNPLLARAGTTIFESMSALAREHKAVNLGQGFPDLPGPPELLRAAADAVLAGPHQYPPMAGLPELRAAVAAHHARFWGLAYDWRDEVVVTSGATEALMDAFATLLSPGDEAIIIEPAYDTYAPALRLLGATPVPVRCEAPTWTLPRAQLAAAITSRTKVIVFNSPMNPTGRVFGDADLAWLADFVIAHDLYVVCDDVYEHLVFAPARHQPLATWPGLRDRCIRIGSAGKTFSVTGWKVGYAVGPATLMRPLAKAHQLTTFSTPPHLQLAVAAGLAYDDEYFAALKLQMQRGRDYLQQGLAALGLSLLASEGTYFAVADMAAWMHPTETDVEFCHRLVRDAGVVVIPLSAFYSEAPPRSLVRFCFSKNESTIDNALTRLSAWKTR